MDFLSERLARIGSLIWAFPIGLALLFALYFAIRPRGPGAPRTSPPDGRRPMIPQDPPPGPPDPPDPNAQMSLAPTGSRLGCVWTLAGVWITLWLILVFRN
jgi:hypothetical protein